MIDRRQIRKSHQKAQPVQIGADAINAAMLQYLAAEARGDEKMAADFKARYEGLVAAYDAQPSVAA